MAPRWLLAPLVLTLLASCATGFEDDSPDRRRDAGRGADANVGACNPPCGFGATCIAGDCVLSPGVDEDGDGVDAEVDCDDKDPDIGARAERPCEGPCGPGVERCLHGVWGECTPTSDEGCDCAPGSPPRETTCGRCGTATQLCEDGSWTVGACMGEGVCTPGDRERTTEPCGTCGQRERARTCLDTCEWDRWTEFGACGGGAGVCTPGQVDRDVRSCGGCGGTQERTRTCTDRCAWGDWTHFGACGGGGGACTPGELQTEERRCCWVGSVQRRTRSCASDCTWRAWGNWGLCSGGEVCAPNQEAPCDYCTRRICGPDCEWGTCAFPPDSPCL
ncbi:MAG: hypothetical protein KF901_29850 [Myxococcales bacterium]|nr:hypothetical protein [Myxococcales bacterium]